MSKVPNIQKVITKVSTVDGKIKFDGDAVTYTLAAVVLEKVDFAKYKIGAGSTVEVGIDGTNVNFLKKIKVEQATTSTPAETTAAPATTEKSYIIQAVAANKAVLKFKDYTPDSWIAVSEALQKEDFQALGLVARASVYATFETINGKETVVSMKVAPKPADAKPAWQGKSKWQGKSNNYDSPERQTSIEAQAATNAACAIVARMGLSDASKINEITSSIAKSNFALIQELKKK